MNPKDALQRDSSIDRDLSIDRFRGVLVILMVVGDYLSGITWVPAALKHAPDIGFTIADTVAPAFVFVIGMNNGPSFARRFEAGAMATYRHFAMRYLALIGIGAVISAGGSVVGTPTNWGVLQALGVAGLLCLLVIRLPAWSRFVIGGTLLVAYQLSLNGTMLEQVLGSVHGGFFSALSWAALLILSTAVADIYRHGWAARTFCTLVLLAAAAVSVALVPVSKNRVSLSYVLLTLAISAVAFLVVKLVGERVAAKPGLLSWWGESALALYLTHLLVLALFVTPPVTWWYAEAPLWLVILQALVILSFMSFVAWKLHTRRATD